MNIGEKYNMLTCIGKDESRDYRYYLFRCECGQIKSIIACNVKDGYTKSCGCRPNKGNTKHGMHGTKLYGIWKGIRERCNNPNTNRHHIYHDKGISICEEWNDFTNFSNWAMENGYEDGLTIDRIDVNGNYEPSNCRWATQKEQANNKSNSRYLSFNGETHTLGEWASITGISLRTIWKRLDSGWSVEEALTVEPFVGRNNRSA